MSAMLVFLYGLQLVTVIVIVIGVGFVRVKGIAHWVASRKVPVAK